MPRIIEFRPKKELLNSNFEKYQFSSDIVAITEEINLSKSVFHQEPLAGQDSWLEARLFAFHNHLFKNPHDDSCWFVDEDSKVWCLKKNGELSHVHTFASSDTPSSYNPTVAFASDNIAVLTNGGNYLCIFVYGTEPHKSILVDNADKGVLMDARYIKEKNLIVTAVCCIVEEKGKKHSKIIVLHHSLKEEESAAELVRRHELLVRGPVDCIYIESTGTFVDVLSQDQAKIQFDSVKPVKEEKNPSEDSELKIPKYCWSQDEDSLTVWLKIPEKYHNTTADVKVTATALSVTVEDTVLVQGECPFRLDAETAVWSTDKDTLKLELMKHESGQMWSELIKGDTGGECLPNETLAAEIHSRLSHLCTGQPEGESDQPAIGFNAEQLEECDLEGKQNYLQRIDLHEHTTTHLAILGTHNHVLFTQKLKASQLLCIRHDHDGCVWKLEDNSDECTISHTDTFPGFGYVEASKTNKKFCISPPNCHYVAVVEHSRHAFIYEKPPADAKVAKQKIVDLGAESLPIVGATATNEYLVLLTKEKIYKLKVET